jgi:ABC-type uncharacterized transport system auxiliary subunit
MMAQGRMFARSIVCAAVLLLVSCTALPIKQYYVLNYITTNSPGLEPVRQPFPYTVRLKDFDIEDAYARPQIVYRQSPFELRYYVYKLWAVKPNRMISDLVYNHLVAAGVFSRTIRRYDEGLKPEYELSGTIQALEEYDSDELWFAHLAIRFSLTRLSDGKTVYSRTFDNRKRVYKYSPESIVQEMSAILDFTMNQVVQDMDGVFVKKQENVFNAPPAGIDSVATNKK